MRSFITPTLDPKAFGAVVVGKTQQPDGRWTNLVSEPSPDQFHAAAVAMSRHWDRLNKRLQSKARRAGAARVGYFRVVELHRNAWPHYHVVLEHPEWGVGELRHQLDGWRLGRIDARPVSLQDAVGEVAPYLVSPERKAGGSKAYQFAARALPKGFRLYSASRGFLGEVPREDEGPDYGVALRGHFTEYHRTLRELGADVRLVLHAPSEEHVPPARTVARGDAALVYFASLVEARGLHMGHGYAALAAREALS